ncbi:hypothetical protein V8Z80_01425 [Orrella sp. JC864]|uniref:hypothetical protein n=1 Tax=Orrella sp. JC864 TaxID=3120298 RepID=UPI00300B3F23
MTATSQIPPHDQEPERPDSPSPEPAPSIPARPDDARARPDPVKKPATGGSAGSGNAAQAQDAGKVLPPSSPVQVPRMPAPPTEGTPDEAAQYGKPRADTGHDSNWADNVKPKPDAKNARSSLF